MIIEKQCKNCWGWVKLPCGRQKGMPNASAILCTSKMGNEVVTKYDGITSKILMVLAYKQPLILTFL